MKKNPIISGILNIIPGLGHVYLGNWKRGLLTFIVMSITVYLLTLFYSYLLNSMHQQIITPCYCVWEILWLIIFINDGYKAGKKFNQENKGKPAGG
jgi:uncharacterized membrane protein YccC